MQKRNARARDRPGVFYKVNENQDGTADVYLMPDGSENGWRILVLRGILPWVGMEEDIRLRYNDWCASAEPMGITDN